MIIPAGSLLMNRGGNPTILNSVGTVLVPPAVPGAMGAADRMSTLDSGAIINVTTSGIETFTSALALSGTHTPGGSTRGSSALLAGALLYGATKSGGQTNLLTYSPTGSLLSTNTIVVSGTLYRSIAMAPDGVTVYFAENGGDEVWVKTIGGGAASVLIDFLALGWFVNCLQNLRDGRIAVGLQRDGDPDGPGRVTIINPDGSIDIDIDIDYEAIYLAIDITDAHLWVGMYVEPAGTIWRMARLDTSTGAVGATFDLPVSGGWDNPFVVLQQAITAPSPTTPSTTIVSSTPCCDTAAGPTTSATGELLPYVGPGWTPEEIGGGVVPSAADINLIEVWDY